MRGTPFALPHLLGDVVPGAASVLIATSCPACNRPHAWNVDRHRPPDGDQVAHFLVPAAQMWDDVVHTCAHQRLFCSTGCVEDWLHRTGAGRGYVMDLVHAVAVGCALVRRSPHPRLPSPRSRHWRRLSAHGRPVRAILGALVTPRSGTRMSGRGSAFGRGMSGGWSSCSSRAVQSDAPTTATGRGNGRTSDEGGGVMEGRHREALIGSCSSLNHVPHCSAGSDACALL